MRLVYITLARKILCYGSFPAKVLLGTNAYNSLIEMRSLLDLMKSENAPRCGSLMEKAVSYLDHFCRAVHQAVGKRKEELAVLRQ